MIRITLLSLLIVGLLSTHVYSSEEDDISKVFVTCGSVIKLEHKLTKYLLNSQDISYGHGRGSGQQSVTSLPDQNSATSLWIVRGDGKNACKQGSPLTNGAHVRLQHAMTRKWLHSHNFASPLSNNQEISAYGDDGHGDNGDIWVLELSKNAPSWERDADISLKHKDTGAYLGSHEIKYQRPIAGQQEVFGAKSRNKFSEWAATEGIYYR